MWGSAQPIFRGIGPRETADRARGFSLIELIVTLAVLTILTLSVVPLVKISVKRQREQQLRERLREMQEAIDQFHREALAGMGLQQTGSQPAAPGNPNQQQGQFANPRVRLAIVDQTIFGVDNTERYPPDLETLVSGVSVVSLPAGGQTGSLTRNATEGGLTSTKKRVYLRAIPVDPMTGQAEWDLRSIYDSYDATSWGGENVFNVKSKSRGTALDGTKYSDW